MTSDEHWDGWAVMRRTGTVIVDLHRDATEASIWQIALGWPSAQEIAWEKRNGAEAFRVRVSRITEEKQ